MVRVHSQNTHCSHLSLFVGSYFAASQVRGVGPRVKMHHTDPSVDTSINTARQLEQVFQPYRRIFKELKERQLQFPITIFLQNENTKK
jgi:hypothetical protein